MHVQLKLGRKHRQSVAEETEVVLDTHRLHPAGVLHTAKRLRLAHDISYHSVYRIMKKAGLVTASAARTKKRKYVRYERMYSNAMWHVDWHTMKDPRFRNLQLVTYLDDSSRCIMAAQLFTEATSANAVLVLRKAIRIFGTPATILSDNGRCFVGHGGRRKAPAGSWKPTAFEAELLDCGIELINSRPHHPQTNGKLERLHGSIENEIWHHETLSSYVKYYNEERLYGSLDIDNGETPLVAFERRRATDAIRKRNPKWMEKDTDEDAK